MTFDSTFPRPVCAGGGDQDALRAKIECSITQRLHTGSFARIGGWLGSQRSGAPRLIDCGLPLVDHSPPSDWP